MTTERNDRTNNYGRNDENRERRPYSNNREGYGNNDYNRSYNRPSNDNRRGSGYGNRDDYNRPQQNYGRPQRPYNGDSSNYQGNSRYSSNESENGMDTTKKRRPRVGDVRSSGNNSYGNERFQGGYGNNRPQGRSYGNNRPQGNRPQRNNNNNPNNKYSFQKQLKYREENFDPNEPIRLNKYLANAGVCSRREADEFIKAGVVSVNGEVVNELGTKVKRADKVMFHNQPVKLEQKVYVLLNKPKNCVTTADDPQERLTVMDLVKGACHERIFPVGRLDRNTTGVLLLTNDGDLASKLTHPKFLKKKIYHVWLDKPVSIDDMQKIADGIQLEDGEIHADAISYVTDTDKDQIGIEIHSGRNRIVRRIFETLGYHVMKLDRVYFAGLTKKQLKKGHWRYLTEKEVSMLRMGAFE